MERVTELWDPPANPMSPESSAFDWTKLSSGLIFWWSCPWNNSTCFAHFSQPNSPRTLHACVIQLSNNPEGEGNAKPDFTWCLSYLPRKVELPRSARNLLWDGWTVEPRACQNVPEDSSVNGSPPQACPERCKRTKLPHRKKTSRKPAYPSLPCYKKGKGEISLWGFIPTWPSLGFQDQVLVLR